METIMTDHRSVVKSAAEINRRGANPCRRSAELVAHDLVHGLALGGAMRDQLFQLRGRPFGEDAILECGCIDVDVQCGAAQSREPRQHADTAVADDIEIAMLAGAP